LQVYRTIAIDRAYRVVEISVEADQVEISL